MLKSAIIGLQMMLITAALLIDSIDSRKEFDYVGSFKPRLGRSIQNFNENDYYISLASVTTSWTVADAECKNAFGANSSLVSIETLEEWNFLKIALEHYGFGSTYWTSGLYDAGSKVWKWSSNGEELLPWAPWDNKHPLGTNTALRVIIFHSNRYSAFFRTVFGTQSHRYICEVQETMNTIPCSDTNQNLIIVLDSSGSIGSHNFKQAKHFAANLVTEFTSQNAGQIGFLTFSDSVSTIFNITNKLSSSEMRDAILNTTYLNGVTATYLGIDEAIKQFNSSSGEIPLNIVVITDGESNNITETAATAIRASESGIRMFSIGITSSANYEELLFIANGDTNSTFISTGCDQLMLLLDPLQHSICIDEELQKPLAN